MKYDFRDSNIGFKTQHIPNIDMRKFDGKDLVTCDGLGAGVKDNLPNLPASSSIS